MFLSFREILVQISSTPWRWRRS